MKKLLLSALLTLSATIASAQELNFQAGKSISTFKFEDSQGNELPNLQSTDNFFMTLEYRHNVLSKYFKDKMFADLGIGYNRYGSTGSDFSVDNYYVWDVTYIGINLGLDYEFYRPGNFTFYVKGSASPEILIRGTQTIDNQVYDLVGADDFDMPIYFFRAGLGTRLQLSGQTSIYVQYMGGKSYNFNGDPEKLNVVAHNFGFGFLIHLSKAGDKVIGIDPANERRMDELENRVNNYSEKIDALEQQAQRVEELEEEVRIRELEMKKLKDAISHALFEFEGKGLQVNRHDGKIYVTMDIDLLFESGSWTVGKEGTRAVEKLGQVLALNPDIPILIEGHTDNQPYRGSGNIKDNWDLSLKRATAFVEILISNPDINPKNITAAGRGEHHPIASNETAEGRAKNRRIEVILTPKLDEASKILKH